jgi:hypothetical protein
VILAAVLAALGASYLAERVRRKRRQRLAQSVSRHENLPHTALAHDTSISSEALMRTGSRGLDIPR